MTSLTTTPDGTPEYTCSAWAAFDALQLCFTPLPQLRHYYRYGSWKDCAPPRKEFLFCIQMKSKTADEGQKLIGERHQEKERRKFEDRPSIGVWKLRESPPPDFPPPLSSIPHSLPS
ncbi:hypothetical protein SmJEL517_g03457 [Synchytrium microbalum]|uniref:Uncharacterized protein n=1 Tax=Synchytrium microbalum TaxID=1806994 RepID=A0A507C2V1_9FUNG|nr:uncharacterized protein SmJEL517_g03457 [Synchytrium microbalum]TPX33761.1 hypothetical protein SmJEL517_g03457 [Synchytrium microbalum]